MAARRKMYRSSISDSLLPEPGSRAIHVVNADGKRFGDPRFLLWFGAYGPTFVLVYARHLEAALEDAAEFLADSGRHWLVMPHDKVKSTDDLGCDCADPFECDAHTYTESGWIGSDEWGIVAERPSNRLLVELHTGVR